jgi:hypothetical protein
MYFVPIWEWTATFALYKINRLVFITKMKSVYWAVRTGYFKYSSLRCVFKRLRLLPSGFVAVKFGMYKAASHSVTERLSMYLWYCFTWHRLDWELVNNVAKKQTASVFRNNGRGSRLSFTWKVILSYKPVWDSKLVILKQFHKSYTITIIQQLVTKSQIGWEMG